MADRASELNSACVYKPRPPSEKQELIKPPQFSEVTGDCSYCHVLPFFQIRYDYVVNTEHCYTKIKIFGSKNKEVSSFCIVTV